MNITKIEQQKKNKQRYSVFLDGEYGFGLHESILFRENLQTGDTLSARKISSLQEADAIFSAREAAFNLLKYRERSISELRSRLLRKGFELHIAEQVVKDLETEGYLNDLEFSRTLAKDLLVRKNIGPIRLRSELYNKQVPGEIVDQVVEESYRDVKVIEIARAAARKKADRLTNADKKTAYRRLTGYLGRRGFSWEIINQVLDEIDWN